MNIIFREFTESDADYELLLMIDNSDTQFPKTIDDLRLEQTRWKPEQVHILEFILLDGDVIGSCIHYNQPGEGKGTHSGFMTLLPSFQNRGLEKPVLEHLIDSARQLDAQNINTNTREGNLQGLEIIKELGFEPTVSFVYSQIDVASFEVKPLKSKIEKVESEGIRIVSAVELRSQGIEPFADLQRMMSGEVNEEFWVRQHREEKSPRWFPESQWMAYDGERFVGIAFMSRCLARSDLAHVSYTTTHPDYRRRGIATALKVASIEAAKRCGIRSAITCNESTIPMLQLNVQLGFKKVFGNLCFRKVF